MDRELRMQERINLVEGQTPLARDYRIDGSIQITLDTPLYLYYRGHFSLSPSRGRRPYTLRQLIESSTTYSLHCSGASHTVQIIPTEQMVLQFNITTCEYSDYGDPYPRDYEYSEEYEITIQEYLSTHCDDELNVGLKNTG